jgi:predicted aminopeptidase
MMSYLAEQGVEQVKLQWNGRRNEEFLNDPNITQEMKNKVVLVEEYKKFFYFYFEKKSTDIYSKTTILSDKAVTYLVIASSHTKIKPHDFKFPFMGSFPYIGFFKKESAEEFAKDLNQDENLVTYIRPVYAYSTLGYFEDRILSSFFHYDDVELAELVFHELFHTVFFIKDEVDLNENLANLFGKELLYEYFKGREELQSYLKIEKKKELLSKRVVELIGILQDEFSKLGVFITDSKADELTNRFVTEVFLPDIRSYCQTLDLPQSECEIKEDWNQAAFAAFLTYEEEQDFLQKLKGQLQLDLKQFLFWLNNEYKSFNKKSNFQSFTDHLRSKLQVTDAPAPSH